MAILTICCVFGVIIDGQKRNMERLLSRGITIVRQYQSHVTIEMNVSLSVDFGVKTPFSVFILLLVGAYTRRWNTSKRSGRNI